MWNLLTKCEKIGPKRGNIEAWGLPGTSFGGSGGHVGAQGGPNGQKVRKRELASHFLGTLFWTFFGTLSQIEALCGSLFLGLFLDWVWD